MSAALTQERWAHKVLLSPSEKGDMGILFGVLLIVHKVV